MWPVWAVYEGDKTTMFTSAVDKAKAMNEKNDYMLELTATDLITDGGKVVGVKAVYHDGTTYEIYGDSVILATGGFLGNAEMTEEYLGGTFSAEAMLQNKGAGVQMAMALGAGTYNIDMPGMVPHRPDQGHHQVRRADRRPEGRPLRPGPHPPSP